MRALYYDKKLELKKGLPLQYTASEALIKVTMAGICNTDIEITKGYMGFKGVPGHEFVGIVEKAKNEKLTGKRVTGDINCVCHECEYCRKNIPTHCLDRTVLGIFNRNGAFSDYLTLPEENLHIIPDIVTDEEAVFIEPLAAAFEIFEQVDIKHSHRVVVLGDGKLGLLIAQVMALRTSRLTVVGKHYNKLKILEEQDIQTYHVNDLPELKADIVVEATGSASGLEQALKIVKPGGMVILKSTIAGTINVNLSKVVVDEITFLGSRCGPFEPAIDALKKKKVNVKPLISRKFDFDNAIEAIEYAQTPGVLKVLLKM